MGAPRIRHGCGSYGGTARPNTEAEGNRVDGRSKGPLSVPPPAGIPSCVLLLPLGDLDPPHVRGAATAPRGGLPWLSRRASEPVACTNRGVEGGCRSHGQSQHPGPVDTSRLRHNHQCLPAQTHLCLAHVPH